MDSRFQIQKLVHILLAEPSVVGPDGENYVGNACFTDGTDMENMEGSHGSYEVVNLSKWDYGGASPRPPRRRVACSYTSLESVRWGSLCTFLQHLQNTCKR